MKGIMIAKSLLVWLAVIPLAVLNGGFRDAVLVPAMGESRAFVFSGLILCMLVFAVALLFVPRLGRATLKKYILMGLVWIAATVVFETGLGLAMGRTLGQIAGAYDPSGGNLWTVVVLFIGMAPLLAAKIRKTIVNNDLQQA